MSDIENLSDVENFQCTPPDLMDDVNAATLNMLPLKSKNKYLQEYKIFKDWCIVKKAQTPTENVILAYLYEKSKTYKPSSLWSKYSMIKLTLMVNDNVDIKYPKVIAYLKRQSADFKPKKSEILTREDMNKFLLEAPDVVYLCMKVLTIFYYFMSLFKIPSFVKTQVFFNKSLRLY